MTHSAEYHIPIVDRELGALAADATKHVEQFELALAARLTEKQDDEVDELPQLVPVATRKEPVVAEKEEPFQSLFPLPTESLRELLDQATERQRALVAERKAELKSLFA